MTIKVAEINAPPNQWNPNVSNYYVVFFVSFCYFSQIQDDTWISESFVVFISSSLPALYSIVHNSYSCVTVKDFYTNDTQQTLLVNNTAD